MTKAYVTFTELFTRLSPFQLNHLTEILLCKIEECFEGKLASAEHMELTEHHLQYALINTMREALLEIYEHESKEQQNKLHKKKTQMFPVERLAA